MLRVRFVAVVGASVVVVAASPASATHYDNIYPTSNTTWNCTDGGYFCLTDNATLTWFDETSITYTGRTNINTVLEGTFEPTDLSVSFTSTTSYSGSAETDLIFRQGTLPSGVIGQARCDDANNLLYCDQHYLTFVYSTPPNGLICHEAGHGVGLTHGANAAPAVGNGDDSLACMQTPDSEVTAAVLGSHNSAQINATY